MATPPCDPISCDKKCSDHQGNEIIRKHMQEDIDEMKPLVCKIPLIQDQHSNLKWGITTFLLILITLATVAYSRLDYFTTNIYYPEVRKIAEKISTIEAEISNLEDSKK